MAEPVEPEPVEPEPVQPAPVEMVVVTPQLWRTFRDVRLASLLDAPRAFANTYAVSAACDEDWWRARVSNGVTWLAFDGDRPVGTVGVWQPEGIPAGDTYLGGMWVAAPGRGRGVGDALVRTALDHARELGFTQVLLDVAIENAPARALYERHGFVPNGSTWRNPICGGIDEIGYAVNLT